MPYRVRPNVMKMRAYSPGKPIDELKRELGLAEVVKLASNENPLGPSPKAVAAVKDAASGMNLYPDASGYAVKQKISERFEIDPKHIVLGNGSDEVLNLIGQVFLGGHEDVVVAGSPSFVRYRALAQLADCAFTSVPVNGHWRHDLVAMATAITPATKLVFIDNPGNPTGTILNVDEVDEFMSAIPEGVVIVFDEAYYEFARHEPGYPDSLRYLRDGKPVIVVRTLSKSYGLAGIRIGYTFAPVEVVDAIDRVREPFAVNSLAQVAAIAALDDDEHLANTLAVNREGRDRVSERMSELGFDTIESFANFICIDVKRPAQEVAEALLRQGVIVRSGHALGMPRHIRVSIGTPDEMIRFLEAFESVTN
ncbi:MAG: histidinol-phosphate transaminase [Armatimonadetes bacterium]|nr:histidinol-phosphate transaminase [Armatimonadota bacterium]